VLANQVAVSGIVVTPIMEHDLRESARGAFVEKGTYLSFRMKVEHKRGKITDTTYVRVNIFSENQKRIMWEHDLGQGQKVWVSGELMARKEGDDGKDVVEIRALQVDRILGAKEKT